MWQIKDIHGLSKGNSSPSITNRFQLWRNLGGLQIERSLWGANSCDAVDSNTGHRLPTTENRDVRRKLLQMPLLVRRSVKNTGIAVPEMFSWTLKKEPKYALVNLCYYRNPLPKFVTEFRELCFWDQTGTCCCVCSTAHNIHIAVSVKVGLFKAAGCLK